MKWASPLTISWAIVLLASQANAGFVGGVEAFNGTLKDTSSWEEFRTASNQNISQNNAIFLDTGSPGNPLEYSTRLATIGIGGTVAVDVVPSATASAALYVTNNSRGTSDLTAFDSAYFLIEFVNAFHSIDASVGGNGSGGGVGMDIPASVNSFKLQISRLNATSASFQAFSPSGTSLLQTTLSCSTNCASFTPNLYISLVARQGPVTFDNVTLSGNYFVPEPANLLIASLVAIGLSRRRQQRLTLSSKAE